MNFLLVVILLDSIALYICKGSLVRAVLLRCIVCSRLTRGRLVFASVLHDTRFDIRCFTSYRIRNDFKVLNILLHT